MAKEKGKLWDNFFAVKRGDPNSITSKEGIAYSICGFGQNLICSMISAYLASFMTEAIGFSALWVAILMLVARVYDALNDPIMGSIVDRTRTPVGKCRPYLKWMALPIAVMTCVCFLPVYPNNPLGFGIMCVVYIIWGMVYTVSDVPYWGLSTAMTSDTSQRANLLTVARMFCTVGAGVVTLIIPQITAGVTKNYGTASPQLRMAYFIATIVIVAIATPMFFVGYKGTKERCFSTGKAPSLKHNLQLLFKNKPLLLIVLSGILGSAKAVYMYTGALYFAKYGLSDVTFLGMQGEALFTVITIATVPGGLIASVMVPWFQRHFGKKWTFIVSHLVGALAMFVMYFVGYKTGAALVVALIVLVILGIPQGFSNIMTYAMIGDTVDYLEWKTGERAEGICFAMQTFINKIGMAIGAFVGLLAYFMAGLQNSDVGNIDPAGLDRLWAGLVLTGAISMLACAIPLFFYKFDEKAQRMAVAEVASRKAAAAAEAGDNGIDAQ